MAHRSGESRHQATLFPVLLDELVDSESMVRVIDAWVHQLNLDVLGFSKAQAHTMGRPPYHPGDLLRLYIWGYLNAVRSSRALERECHRNVECMWLLGRLAPDHKTIADFRRVHSQALVHVCASFVQFALSAKLISGHTVAIDGTKVRAVASRSAIVSKAVLQQRHREQQAQIARYLNQLDEQDSRQPADCANTKRIRAALDAVRAQAQRTQTELEQLQSHQRSTLIQTEPQAQVMKSLHNAPGYNLQTAVDTESHLVVHQEVNSKANDSTQLQPVAQAAAKVLSSPCKVVADAGYANGEQLAELEQQGIIAYVAPNRAVNNQGEGNLLDRAAFIYSEDTDCYTCPQGKTLARKQLMRAKKMVVYEARMQDCAQCSLKPQCTQAQQRFVSRHLFEQAHARNVQRLEVNPQMMTLRRQTVEHPYGTIKHQILGNARLLMRGLTGAKAELSLAVLAYNLKRAMNMKGASWMLNALRA